MTSSSLLLVQNRRRDGSLDWSPPGGVIDPGESLLEGLTREVGEETGLAVRRWEGPVYEVVCEAPDLGWRLRVEAHRALEWDGELVVDDPDGIVVDARFVPLDACAGHLGHCHPWVREPLAAWLDEPWAPGGREAPFHFHVAGADAASAVVTRRPTQS